ncbi:magnesium transporter [Streptomyces azureus]|uniref:Magnesium transporter n=1 Tax=Streptomyces azureus TaxID=146537 RepID=A0A0K8PQ94_STRAJ|nr:magnesium transporter [Streptomyces azureus]
MAPREDRTGAVMRGSPEERSSGNGPGLRDRWRGAFAAGLFGCVVAGPQELLDSGIGWDLPLTMLVGAAAGGAVGFVFPYALSRRRRQPPSAPPPPCPPPPPPPPERRT